MKVRPASVAYPPYDPPYLPATAIRSRGSPTQWRNACARHACGRAHSPSAVSRPCAPLRAHRRSAYSAARLGVTAIDRGCPFVCMPLGRAGGGGASGVEVGVGVALSRAYLGGVGPALRDRPPHRVGDVVLHVLAPLLVALRSHAAHTQRTRPYTRSHTQPCPHARTHARAPVGARLARAKGEIYFRRTLCKNDFPNPVDERKLTYEQTNKQTRDMQTDKQTNTRRANELRKKEHLSPPGPRGGAQKSAHEYGAAPPRGSTRRVALSHAARRRPRRVVARTVLHGALACMLHGGTAGAARRAFTWMHA